MDLSSSSLIKSKQKRNTKCSWCDRKRARNDLCNVCRQKVESRARRLMEQKLDGDMEVIQKVIKYLNQNIPSNVINNQEIINLILECFPFLMLKFQSENTYRGKKGNRCWCLPESVLKKLIIQFYIKDKLSQDIISKGGRQELCNLLMSTVSNKFNKYGIKDIKPLISHHDIKKEKKEKNSETIRSLKRVSMDDDDINTNNSSIAPPRKKPRRGDIVNHNHTGNSNEIHPDHQIWGRSDTNLLSFDIKKLEAFLHKFQHKVLNGAELEQIESSQRVDFLKKRCKEFVKILTELRDYVMHLRTKVKKEEENQQLLVRQNEEISQLKQRIDAMLSVNGESDKLIRCTTNLLSKLAPNPVDTQLLRTNMDKLEQYHDLACNELTEAVRSFESIGCKLGYQRSSDMTLKQYAAHINMNVMNNNSNNSHSLGALYMQPNNINTNNNNNNNNNSSSSISSTSSTPSISSFNSNISNISNISYTNQSTASSVPQSVIHGLQNTNFNNNPFPVPCNSSNRCTLSTLPPLNTNNMNNMNNMNGDGNNNNNRNNMTSNQIQIARLPPPTQQYQQYQQYQQQQQQYQHQHQHQHQQQQHILNNNNNNNNNNNIVSPTANFVTIQPQTIPLNAATLNNLTSLGIIPTITSINPGQHLPTTFNGRF